LGIPLAKGYYPVSTDGAKPRAIGNRAGQLWAFAVAMKEGDLVVMPRKLKSQLALGRVVGSYKYQKRARINCISHLLSSVPYKRVKFEKPDLGKRQRQPKDLPEEESYRNLVPDVFSS